MLLRISIHSGYYKLSVHPTIARIEGSLQWQHNITGLDLNHRQPRLPGSRSHLQRAVAARLQQRQRHVQREQYLLQLQEQH